MLDKIYLEITNVCNLDCSFCHKTSRQKRLMSEEEFNILTDKLCGRAKFLYFHLMGEPTLHPLLPRFIEIAKHCPEHEKRLYLKAALNTLQAMDKSFCRWGDNIDAFLDCGKEMYHEGQSHPIIYGDFFYAEAILKLKGSKFSPWTI